MPNLVPPENCLRCGKPTDRSKGVMVTRAGFYHPNCYTPPPQERTIELPLDVAEQLSLAWMVYVRDGEPFSKEERAKVLPWIEAINKALEPS